MPFDYDALIVGGGPAGCAAAFDLASAGRRVLLLDRRSFPRHKACACGLTRKTLKALRYSVDPILERHCHDVVLQEAGPAFLHGRRSADKSCEVRVHLRHPFCAMAVRERFDHFCLQQTLAQGSEGRQPKLLKIETILALREFPTHIELDLTLPDNTTATLTAPALIGADGSNGQTRRLASGLHNSVAPGLASETWVSEPPQTPRGSTSAQLPPEPTWYARGFALEATVPYTALPPKLPAGDAPHDLVFDFAPIAGGYGWLFPKADHINIGVGGFVPQKPTPPHSTAQAAPQTPQEDHPTSHSPRQTPVGDPPTSHSPHQTPVGDLPTPHASPQTPEGAAGFSPRNTTTPNKGALAPAGAPSMAPPWVGSDTVHPTPAAADDTTHYEAVTRTLLATYIREKLGVNLDDATQIANIHITGQHLGLGGHAYTPQGRILLTGDAAGLVDPLTGEGIHSAITSGQAAAAAILETLPAQAFNPHTLTTNPQARNQAAPTADPTAPTQNPVISTGARSAERRDPCISSASPQLPSAAPTPPPPPTSPPPPTPLKGHDFSRAITTPSPTRLQPLRSARPTSPASTHTNPLQNSASSATEANQLALAYARHLKPLQDTLAFSHRAARSFYREPERGFKVMRTPILRGLVLKTYADGLPTTKLLTLLTKTAASRA